MTTPETTTAARAAVPPAQGLEWKIRRDSPWFSQAREAASVRVDVRSMLGLAVARRCIDAIASDLAAMPLDLVQVTDKDEQVPAVDHPAYGLFRWSPDGGLTTPYRFRQSLVANALAWGDGLAEVVGSPDGSAFELHILCHGAPELRAGKLWYRLSDGKEIEGARVVHVAGLGFDGLRGYPPHILHAHTIGLSIAAERFPGAILGNGAFPGGFIETDFSMGEAAFTNFRDAFVKAHSEGVDKAGRIGFLPPGFKFNPTTFAPQTAQMMELLLRQMLEICRIFGVPPHRVMQYENMHYSTVEAVKAEFGQTTLLPWARCVEEALNLRLLTKAQVLAGYTFRHDFTAYMRADAAGRALMYRTLWGMDAIESNEARVAEGYRRREGGDVVASEIKAKSQAAAPAPAPPP